MRDLGEDVDRVRQLVRTLRRRIVAWQYPPHFQLIEESLAQEFGMSRSPIRQALTHLAAEGLVERLPRRGFRVRQMQLRDVEELYEFRLALELQVVQGLAHKGLPQEELFRLQAMWQNPEALEKQPLGELALLDEAFHAGLAAAYGNQLLLKHLVIINERLLAFREIDFEQNARVEDTCEEHGRILHAIVSRNAGQACELLKHNIHSGLGSVENTIIQLVARSYLNPVIAGGV